MAYYFIDLWEMCVIAELTDPNQAQELMAKPGARYGVIETDILLEAKPPFAPMGLPPAGTAETSPDYGPLEVQGIVYTPLVVADVLADYELTPGEIHCDEVRYQLGSDASGYVRDINRLSTVPPPRDFLRVITDAADTNPPDGYPDIPADGISTCQITLQKTKGDTGADMVSAGDNELIQIGTDAGKLSAVQVNLVNGYAEVTLTSSTDTLTATLRAFDPGNAIEEGSIQIQFT